MFISINGFAILDDKILRRRWRAVRNLYNKSKRRIHATDSHFRDLREKSIKLLGRHNVSIISVFQLIQEIPYEFFDKDGVKLDVVYGELLKKLFFEISLEKYQKVRIIIDAQKHKGGRLAEQRFCKDMKIFLEYEFLGIDCEFKQVASYVDVLLELADFVSNTLYKEYQKDSKHVFQELGLKFIQIKNPLS